MEQNVLLTSDHGQEHKGKLFPGAFEGSRKCLCGKKVGQIIEILSLEKKKRKRARERKKGEEAWNDGPCATVGKAGFFFFFLLTSLLVLWLLFWVLEICWDFSWSCPCSCFYCTRACHPHAWFNWPPRHWWIQPGSSVQISLLSSRADTQIVSRALHIWYTRTEHIYGSSANLLLLPSLSRIEWHHYWLGHLVNSELLPCPHLFIWPFTQMILSPTLS